MRVFKSSAGRFRRRVQKPDLNVFIAALCMPATCVLSTGTSSAVGHLHDPATGAVSPQLGKTTYFGPIVSAFAGRAVVARHRSPRCGGGIDVMVAPM